jgi:hypothetical protein
MTADQPAAIYAQLGGQDNADTQQNITQYFATEKRRLELQAVGKELSKERYVNLWSIGQSFDHGCPDATDVKDASVSVQARVRVRHSGAGLHGRSTWNRVATTGRMS